MSMKPKNTLPMYAMMAALGVPHINRPEPTGRVVSTNVEKPIPKGCKKYYFRSSGHFEIGGMQWNDVSYVFTCIASNDKTAVKKFNKWKMSQKE